MSNSKKSIAAPFALVIGASLAGAAMTTASAENPFGANELSSGYMQLAAAHSGKDGSCGEGKCGANKKSGKEGSCGMASMDANKDGKVTKQEFMSYYEKQFAAKDANKNGVLEASELKGREGSCGGKKTKEGKCGASS